ncbi:MAG TPA: hypothetical protein VK586_01800 [Streptosporangiaceae bacterium]|nr:hypothetical protein [Streptosporangiaceae bacterium]
MRNDGAQLSAAQRVDDAPADDNQRPHAGQAVRRRQRMIKQPDPGQRRVRRPAPGQHPARDLRREACARCSLTCEYGLGAAPAGGQQLIDGQLAGEQV